MYIGKNLKKILDEKEMSQTRFCEIINMKPPNFSKYYKNHREPKAGILVRFADALNCTTDELLGRS
jgi:transcriptional regulator with XRE-family HTH domain